MQLWVVVIDNDDAGRLMDYIASWIPCNSIRPLRHPPGTPGSAALQLLKAWISKSSKFTKKHQWQTNLLGFALIRRLVVMGSIKFVSSSINPRLSSHHLRFNHCGQDNSIFLPPLCKQFHSKQISYHHFASNLCEILISLKFVLLLDLLQHARQSNIFSPIMWLLKEGRALYHLFVCTHEKRCLGQQQGPVIGKNPPNRFGTRC